MDDIIKSHITLCKTSQSLIYKFYLFYDQNHLINKPKTSEALKGCSGFLLTFEIGRYFGTFGYQIEGHHSNIGLVWHSDCDYSLYEATIMARAYLVTDLIKLKK